MRAGCGEARDGQDCPFDPLDAAYGAQPQLDSFGIFDAPASALPGDHYAPRLPDCPPLFLLPETCLDETTNPPAERRTPPRSARMATGSLALAIGQKRKMIQLSNGDRKWICNRKIKHPRETHTMLADAFKKERNPDVTLRPSTISTIIKHSDKWLAIPDGKDQDKRSRPCQEPMLEASLLAWYNDRVAMGDFVADEQLRAEAKNIACRMGINSDKTAGGLTFSSGWLCNFKKRNGLRARAWMPEQEAAGAAALPGEAYPPG